MERSDDDDESIAQDLSSGNLDDEDPEYVERDPTGRYGRFDDILGKGAYKTVYRAFDDLDGMEVAWNQVNMRNTVHNTGDMARLYSELHLLKMLKHENIMKFCNSWVDPYRKNVNFITEIFTSGTLRLYRQKHKHVSSRAIKHWSRQILQGLVYLHGHNPPIIHRDLKCDNIFINGNSGEVKIGDLGLAVILSQAPAAHSVIGTPEFMAPELYEEHYNELVDVYSFGMCLLELVTFEYPYSECTNAAQIYKRVTSGRRPEALNKVKDQEMRKFIEKCLASASERLHAKELLMDQFLQLDMDQGVTDSYQSMILDPDDDLRDLYPYFRPLKSQTVGHTEDAGKEFDSCQDKFSEEGSGVKSGPSETRGLDFQRRALRRKRSRDFRIKVKKQSDRKVHVRLRITSSKGGVRYIQFDFELETDTAIDVANEMVSELDLADQDPAIIAGLIDTELMALLPDWKPGSCLEEAEVSKLDSKQHELTLENSDVNVPTVHMLDMSPVSLGTTDDPCPSSEVQLHGRFAEVGFNLSGSHHTGLEPDNFGGFSDFSSEHVEGGGSDLSLDASFDRLNAESTINNMVAGKGVAEVTAANVQRETFPHTEESSLSLLERDTTRHKLDDEIDPEELRFLILQQKQEIESLQSKHNEELLYLKGQLSTEAQSAAGYLLVQDHLLLETVDGEVLESIRNEGQFFQHADNEVTEMLLKAVKEDGLESAVWKTHWQPLNVSDELSRLGLDDNGCRDTYLHPESSIHSITDSGMLAVQAMFVSEGCDNAEGNVDSTIPYTDKETNIDKPVSVLSAETADAQVGEIIESKGSTASHLLKSSTEPDSLSCLGLPTSISQEKAFAVKRQSFLEYYKAGSTQRQKVLPEQHGSSNRIPKSLDSTNDAMEQVRKQQVQKSIADLEAKTLECLSQSRSYVAKSIGKNASGASAHGNSQPASLSRQ